MNSHDLIPGDTVYLVPTLLSAPAAAYRQPQVTVLSVEYQRATVRLPDGHELTTSVANLARRPYQPKPSSDTPARPSRPALELPDGWEEVTLW